MKNIKVNGNSYQIPTDWNEITLGKQLEVERLSAENPDYKILAVIAGYTGIQIDELKKLNVNEVKVIYELLGFLNTPLPNTSISEFEYKGEKYYLIPSLLKAEFQDFLSIETAMQNFKASQYKALPYIIAVVSKKKKDNGYESLSDYDLEQRAKHFLELPISIANQVNVFFCLVELMSNLDYQQYLEGLNLNIVESINNTILLTNKQVGTGWLTRLQMKALSIYLKFIKLRWTKYYSSFKSEV